MIRYGIDLLVIIWAVVAFPIGAYCGFMRAWRVVERKQRQAGLVDAEGKCFYPVEFLPWWAGGLYKERWRDDE